MLYRLVTDCYLFIDDATRQVAQAKPNGNSLDYVSTRKFSSKEYERFKRHGGIGKDLKRFNDVSFIKHGMSAEDGINYWNNRNKNSGEL